MISGGWEESGDGRFLLTDDVINDDVNALTTSEVIRTTFKLYGTIFACLFILFLSVRTRFPNVYNVRDNVDKLRNPLAKETFGSFRWVYKLYSITDEELFEHCGLDATTFIRTLRFGFQVALVGMFNAIWLIPVNATAWETCPPRGTPDYKESCQQVSDRIEKIGIGNVSSGSLSLIATTVAAYVLFGSAMYLLLQEFKWFTEHRHKFLAQTRPDNYTVFVANIPEKYQTDHALLAYFRRIYSHESVYGANIAVDIPDLEDLVADREKVVKNLEHAINVQQFKNTTPQHRTKICGGEKVDSIPTYTSELEEMNKVISVSISNVKARVDLLDGKFSNDLEWAQSSDYFTSRRDSGKINRSETARDNELKNSDCQDPSLSPSEQTGLVSPGDDDSSDDNRIFLPFNKLGKTVLDGVQSAAQLLSTDEGSPRDAGFVSFTSLKAKASALQMIHSGTPFVFKTQDAPLPKDVYWNNVGIGHERLQVGVLVGLALTALLCLFWTILVTFFTSLAEVSSLQTTFTFLEGWLVAAPWLSSVLAQIKPLTILLLVNSLPIILTQFCKLEGHIAVTTLMTSLLMKLSIFMIIQIFFVQAISGSIMAELKLIATDITYLVEILGSAIPAQVKSFLQFVVVQTLLGVGLELLRVFPIIIAFIRSKVGPNLTEKERNTTWMGLAPLSDPGCVNYPDVMSKLILYYMILFVFSCIAPLMPFIMGGAYALLSLSYRHQFIYIYSTDNDTGGQLWTKLAKLIVACMIISEITVLGVLGLKEGAIATTLFIPLLVITFLFTRYINQQHFAVTRHLPSVESISYDLQNMGQGIDFSFLKEAYLQPALQKKELWPENMPENKTRNESAFYMTPTPSVDGDIELD